MPEQILREIIHRCKEVDLDYLMDVFDVSQYVAEKRIKSIVKYKHEWRGREEKEYDDIIISRYAAFIDKIAPKKISVFLQSNL